MKSTNKAFWILAPFALALILLLILAGAGAQPTSASSPEETAGSGTIEPDLLHVLSEAREDENIPVIVYMHNQANPKAAADSASSATEARVRIEQALDAQYIRNLDDINVRLQLPTFFMEPAEGN